MSEGKYTQRAKEKEHETEREMIYYIVYSALTLSF
jgi:hypothetical protein